MISSKNNVARYCKKLRSVLPVVVVGLMVQQAQAQDYVPKYVLDVQETGGMKNYNGVYPGPVMRVKPGEALNVELVNSLPALNDDCTENMNRPHGLNTTNLHPHGLHVSPDYDSTGEYFSDNVFVSLVPDGQNVECDMDGHGDGMMMNYVWGKAQYRFELPDNHMTGTFWYHAHKHGSTAEQVSDGLAGPLIVEDKPGYFPDYIAQANEKIFVLGNKGLYLTREEGGGELDPVVNIASGEVQRWRIINAMGDGRQYRIPRLSLEGLQVYLIAYDGFTLDKRLPISIDNIDQPWLNPAALSSGNRLDLIVHAPNDYVARENTVEAPKASFLATLIGRNKPASVFTINVDVTGEVVDMLWSDEPQLPGAGLVSFDDSAASQRKLAFTARSTIDGESFDGDVEQKLVLGTSEEWTVSNNTEQLHIYHIHVNPFFITHINGEVLPPDSPLRRWQDTLGIPTRDDGKPGSMTFKTRYEKFTGQFVIHCHVLAHEDQGMMQIVEVVKPL